MSTYVLMRILESAPDRYDGVMGGLGSFCELVARKPERAAP